MASTGSTVGSIVIYGIGYLGGEELLRKRISPERFAKFHQAFQKHPFWSLMFPAMLPPPTPFKLFALTAAVSEMQFSHFLLAIFAGRFVRFLTLSILTLLFGPQFVQISGAIFREHWALVLAGGGSGIGYLAGSNQAKEEKNVGASVPLVRVLELPQDHVGTAAPGCPAERSSAICLRKNPVELRSTGQPRAAVPTAV